MYACPFLVERWKGCGCLIIIDVEDVIDSIVAVMVQFWNMLDTIYIRVGIAGFTVLQLLIAVYVCSWLIYLFFLGSDKVGES